MPEATWKAIEVKSRARVTLVPFLVSGRKLPAWLRDAVSDVTIAAGPERLGVTVLHIADEKGYDNDLVVMRLADLERLFEQETPSVRDDRGVRGHELEQAC